MHSTAPIEKQQRPGQVQANIPPWSAIDTIMFDMDGTLLDLHFDNFFWQILVPLMYAREHDISEREAFELVQMKNQAARGSLNWYCLDYWADDLQLNIKKLKKTITHKIILRPNVKLLLERLRLSEKRILLITNAHPHSLELKMDHTGIDNFFHDCISSHQLSMAKEHHGFWAKLQEVFPYDPERTLLFDDTLPVLRQAQREGIRYLYAIKTPDSKGPPASPGEFPQVEDFGHILP